MEELFGLDAESEAALLDLVLAEAFARTSDEVMEAIGEAVDALGEEPVDALGEESVDALGEEISFDALRAVLDPAQARLISVFQTEYLAVAHEWGLSEAVY